MMFLRKILLHSVSSPKGLLGSSVSVTHRLTVRSCRNSRAPISKHIIRTLRDKIAKPYMPPDLCPYPSLTSNKVKTLYSPDVSDINQLSSNQRRVELQEWPHQRLRALLRSLPALVNQRTPKISSSLLDDLDAECLRRLQHKRIPTQDVVLIADVFVACGYYHGLYHTHLPEYLHLHWEEFSFRLVDILQILFLTCISRCGHVNLFAHIEDFLQNCSHLTGNEAALICSAFYVNRCRLQSMDRLAAIFLRELREGLSDLSGLHSLTKMLSQSSFLDVAFLDDLAEVLMEERLLLQVDPLLSSRLITLWSSKGLSHPQLFSALLRLHPPRAYKRSKDLARLVIHCVRVRHPVPDHFMQHLLQFVRQERLHRRHPLEFVEILEALVTLGQYPDDLVNRALSPYFYAWVKELGSASRHPARAALVFLDTAVSIDRPAGCISRVPKVLYSEFQSGRKGVLPASFRRRPGLGPVYKALREVLGTECVLCVCSLPFSKGADIQIELDAENRPLPINKDRDVTSIPNASFLVKVLPESCRPPVKNQHLKPSSQVNGGRRIVIRVLSWDHYILNTCQVVGKEASEQRLLLTAGWEVFLINPADSLELPEMSDDQQMAYVMANIIQPLQIVLGS